MPIHLAIENQLIRRPALEAETVRLAVTPPDKVTSFDWPTISPDGLTLAFVATVAGKTQVWVRPLHSTTAKPLAEVGNAVAPFWSPDSQFLAYVGSRKLKKMALAGGAPETLCDMPSNDTGSWNREGVILFGGGSAGIRRISNNGGAVTNVTTVDRLRGETQHRAPVFLPDGRHFLFANGNNDGHDGTRNIARRVQRATIRNCRTASKSTMPAAVARFRLRACGSIGIDTSISWPRARARSTSGSGLLE